MASVTARPGLEYINPDRGGFDFWLQSHQNSHREASAATASFLPILDPFAVAEPEARGRWLLDHQKAHNAVNLYLGISGADLSELDWNNRAEVEAWVELNFLEHSQWSNAFP
jgi:hypothetical protein